MIHQRVNQSCELMQPAALKDNGKYASLVIPGTATEIYSSAQDPSRKNGVPVAVLMNIEVAFHRK